MFYGLWNEYFKINVIKTEICWHNTSVCVLVSWNCSKILHKIISDLLLDHATTKALTSFMVQMKVFLKWTTHAICFPVLIVWGMPLCLKAVQRAFTQTVNGHGARVRPKRPCMDGADFPSGSLNVKACIRLVNIRNSSILASCSPMHTLRPIPNGIKQSFLRSFPCSSRNLPGLKSSGFSHTVGSLCTDQRFGMITVPLGIVYPRNSVVSEAMWGIDRGTTTVILSTSIMVASVYGKLPLSVRDGTLSDPTTASISCWTFSEGSAH